MSVAALVVLAIGDVVARPHVSPFGEWNDADDEPSDGEKAIEVAELVCESDSEMQRLLDFAVARARTLAGREDFADAVRHLAAVLVEQGEADPDDVDAALAAYHPNGNGANHGSNQVGD